MDVEEDAGDHDVEDADEEEEEEPEEEEDPEPVEDRGPAKSLTRAQLLQALSGLTATPDRCNYAYSILNLAVERSCVHALSLTASGGVFSSFFFVS